uniref:Inositol polyphosphate-related phosphatase domain-containing protein n=1 Tax=Mucochytrium quahogii TaxID=96639 RepID=A0A7S2RSC8_9STRA
MAIEHFHVYDDPESDGELPKPFNRIPFVYPEDPVTVADIVGTRGKIQLFTMTFNANSLLPDLDAFRASLQTRNRHILYALAFQDLPQHDIEKIINGILGDDYLKMKHAQLGSLQLFVMAHHTIAPLIQNIEADTVALGASLDQDSKSHRAKGAVAICFTIAKKSIIFVNAHFRGKQEAIAARNANFHEINARLKLPTGKLQTLEPISGRFDFAFWLGDLNYRIGLSYDQTWGYLDSANFKSLWEHDQLLKNTNAFDGYIECPLNFPPTFKYLPLTDKYNEKCVPSWTDRILYKSNEECEPVAYDSFDPLKTSTHRAVWGVFSLTLAKPHALWAEWHIRQQAFIQNSEQHHEKLKQQDNKVTQQKKNEQAPLTKQAKTSRTVVFPHDTENSAPARKHASDYCVVM